MQVGKRPLRQREQVYGPLGEIGAVVGWYYGDVLGARRAGRYFRRKASRRQAHAGLLPGRRRDVAAHPRAQRRSGTVERLEAGRVGKGQPHAGVLHQR